MSDLVCGAGAVCTTFTVAEMSGGDWRISLITSVISALIFALINILTKVVTSMLEKKGVISHENKEAIDDTVDDLADDGKINGSNKPKVDPHDDGEVK